MSTYDLEIRIENLEFYNERPGSCTQRTDDRGQMTEKGRMSDI
jgi:hypothetical protein